MSMNPVDLGLGLLLSPQSKTNPQLERGSSSSSAVASVGILSVGSPQGPLKKSHPSESSSGLQHSQPSQRPSERVAHVGRPRPLEAPHDPLMNRLQLRYRTKAKEQLYTSGKARQAARRRPTVTGASSNSNNNGYNSDHIVENSVLALQQETVGMIARHLPQIGESTPYAAMMTLQEESITTGEGMVVDDRITPQTLHALLHKGHTVASRILTQKSSKRRILEEIEEAEKKPAPTAKLEQLRTQVSRLEPPYVDTMLQAKIFKQPINDENPKPREVLPITTLLNKESKIKYEERRSSHVYHSHLIAPPPSRLSDRLSSTRREEENLQRHLSVLSSTTNNYNDDKVATLSVPLTRSTCIGDDGSIIDQLVAYAANKRRPNIGDISLSPENKGIPPYHPSYTPIFSALDAVLSVSKEFEKIQQTWPGGSAGKLAESRRAIVDRISSLNSSRIPRELWVTIHSPTFPGTRELNPNDNYEEEQIQLDEAYQKDGKITSGAHISTKTTLLFPAIKATGRSQVYLLGDALDRMFQEIPDALNILANKEIAQRLLPAAPNDNPNAFKSIEDTARLLDANVIQESDNVHLQYVEAAKEVMNIINIGIIEIVRQISGSCVERGALLDALRQIIDDIMNSALWLVGYCKEQARHEAKVRHELIMSSRKDVEEAIMLREEVREGRREANMLKKANAELESKAAKYDMLMERLQLKDKNFSKHSADQHLRLLMELEENFTQATTKGLELLYERNTLDSTDNEKVFDAPTTHMNNLKNNEKEIAKEELYTESYRLLASLTEAVRSVDIACQPLYERLTLPKPFASSKVATGKWAEIARAVGSYEAEKKHRKQVFDIFARWNNSQNSGLVPTIKLTTEKKGGEGEGEGEGEGDEGKELETIGQPSGASINTTFATSSTIPGSGPTTDVYSPKNESNVSVLNSPLGAPITENSQDMINSRIFGSSKRIKYVTREDLARMGVTDCTPDEINALYDFDFDLNSYLRPEWNPPGDYELNISVIRDMVHDVAESLRHITLRMHALSNSSLLKESTKPPPKPPARPDDPCILCGRKDRVSMEKKSKGEALQRVATEIQRRYEEVVMKCQKAEADRENYRKDLVRQQLREKQQSQEWMKREEELQRANAALLEENKQMAQRLFAIQKSTTAQFGSMSTSLHSPQSNSSGTASGGSDGFDDFDDFEN